MTTRARIIRCAAAFLLVLLPLGGCMSAGGSDQALDGGIYGR